MIGEKDMSSMVTPILRCFLRFFKDLFFELRILVFQKSNNHLLKTIKISPKHHILTRNCYFVSSRKYRTASGPPLPKLNF